MAKEWDTRLSACDICGKEMAARSIPKHMETAHDIYRSRVIDIDLAIDPPQSFNAHISADRKFYCPVPGCPG